MTWHHHCAWLGILQAGSLQCPLGPSGFQLLTYRGLGSSSSSPGGVLWQEQMCRTGPKDSY